MKKTRKNRFFGAVAGIISSIFTPKKLSVKTEDARKMEFSANTQKTGVRFTEKVRNVFRHKWLKIHF